jgi:hypothetical protein
VIYFPSRLSFCLPVAAFIYSELFSSLFFLHFYSLAHFLYRLFQSYWFCLCRKIYLFFASLHCFLFKFSADTVSIDTLLASRRGCIVPLTLEFSTFALLSFLRLCYHNFSFCYTIWVNLLCVNKDRKLTNQLMSYSKYIAIFYLVAPPSRPYRTHTHHKFKITLPNTDQAHHKISVNHYE